MRVRLIIIALFTAMQTQAQFAPQAGLAGSTAMYKDSSAFVDWAGICLIQRGWMQITDTSLGKTTLGNIYSPLGKADGNVLCLGDAGEAVYYFENPVVDGPGYDFAVFENGFLSPEDPNLAYLELAEVSVSNDGISYYTFPSTCLNDTTLQLPGVGAYMDARLLNNLAGKYIASYGTPFDLQELSAILSLDLQNIRYIKIRDVTGSIDTPWASHDQYQHKINDPYPTPFASGGFDLDALGIIHERYPAAVTDQTLQTNLQIYPNPGNGRIQLLPASSIDRVDVLDMLGRMCDRLQQPFEQGIDISHLPDATYLLYIYQTDGSRFTKLYNKHE